MRALSQPGAKLMGQENRCVQPRLLDRTVIIEVPSPSNASSRKKILLVDDEPSFVGHVADYLKSVGYEVGTARDGAEGLRKFQDGAWDLVITDRRMPEMDGDELTTAIKAICPDLPVILITGLPTAGAQHRQADAVLSKPFSRDELLALVKTSLGAIFLQSVT
jgi:CheY-like chemotaxis protein